MDIPVSLRIKWFVTDCFYFLPFKRIRYFIWRIRRACFINKSSRFNFLDYFKSAFRKNSFMDRKPNDFQNYLSVVVIMKNEALYIREWLEYHLMLGVQKFYVYDNESSDNLMEILQPYMEAGIVDYKYFPYTGKQVLAYNDVLEKAREETYWLTAIDIDEFIVPIENKTITDFLKNFEQYAGVEINWLTYGSSGEKHWKEGLVMERFKRHDKLDTNEGRVIKTICNPRAVFKMDVHTPFYCHFAVAVNPNMERRKVHYMDVKQVYDKIRINHYNTKSYDECMTKIQKGRVDGNGEYHLSFFEARDRNDEYDGIMDEYIPLVLANIEKRRKKSTELAEK